MNLFRVIPLLLIISINYSFADVKICLTGKLMQSLSSYKAPFYNGANLAANHDSNIYFPKFLYDEDPLAPIYKYKEMIKSKCDAMIGFEYLSDLQSINNLEKNTNIPIFTSYATTLDNQKLKNNIFIFKPTYNYLASKMYDFLESKFGNVNNVLIATETDRESTSEYEEAYRNIFDNKKIKYKVIHFLEKSPNIYDKFKGLKGKYKYIFLLAGSESSKTIANEINDDNTIFVGTENFGSSSAKTFWYLLNKNNKKNIKAYFIRNIDFNNKSNTLLNNFYSKYKSKYNAVPLTLSAYTYDAVNIVKNAISGGIFSYKNILKHDYVGVTGAYIKGGVFHRSKNYVIIKIKDGKYLIEKSYKDEK